MQTANSLLSIKQFGYFRTWDAKRATLLLIELDFAECHGPGIKS